MSIGANAILPENRPMIGNPMMSAAASPDLAVANEDRT